jgi:hypothetical protein
MSISTIRPWLLAAALFTIAGCSTTSGVIVNQTFQHADYRSVYVVAHGSNSSDMDANLQKEFLRHGFSVSVGPEGGPTSGVQLVARYADDWKWDMAMYLHTFDVMVYDAKSNVMVASGSWKNSTFHGFYSSEKVVAKVVDQTLAKIATP